MEAVFMYSGANKSHYIGLKDYLEMAYTTEDSKYMDDMEQLFGLMKNLRGIELQHYRRNIPQEWED